MINLKDKQSILKYHRWFERQMNALERKHTKTIRDIISEQFEDAADYILHGIGLDSINDAVNFTKSDLTKAYISAYKSTIEVFHQKVNKELKSTYAIDKKASEEEYWYNINKWINTTTAEQVQAVSKTTKSTIAKIIGRGLEEGLSNRDIAKEVLEVNQITTAIRAMKIVRTEVHSAAVFAVDESMVYSGMAMVKMWSSSRDERTRVDHQIADDFYSDNPIPLEEAFVVGNDYLNFPGDPSGSAGNVINCLTPDSKIWYADIDKLTRRFYEGTIVKIKTQSGNEISVTPNHPILTISGWKPARLINEGDNIISADRRVLKSWCNFNIEDINSSIEEIFNSCGIIPSNVRSGTTNMNFHGDISNENVDIISSNGLLGNRFNSFLTKVFDQIPFDYSDFAKGFFFARSLIIKPRFRSNHFPSNLISFFNKQLSFFYRYMFHPFIHGLASISGNYSNTIKSSINRSSIHIHNFCNFLNRISFIKKTLCFECLGIPTSFFSSNFCSFFNRSRFNSKIFKSGSNDIIINTEHFSNTINTLPFIKKGCDFPCLFYPDRVVSNSHEKFLGYVYNLETKNGIYISNGIVNHNCRCVVLYETK